MFKIKLVLLLVIVSIFIKSFILKVVMLHQKNLFMYIPGGENEESGFVSNVNESDETDNASSSDTLNKEKPSLLEKIKDALQDWSNDDQREQQIDDSRP